VKVKPGEVKEISVDGKVVERLSDFVGLVPVVMLAPEDIVLIQGGSMARRRFLDIVLCQADRRYLEALQRYNRILAQRNALLKTRGRLADKELLLTYSKSMRDAAGYICETRNSLCSALLPGVIKYYARLSDSREQPYLVFQSHLHLTDLESVALASLEEDLQLGRTSKGVHRDDLDLLLDDRMVKKYGSQGQVKSLLIALHLAQAEYLKDVTGKTPVLLLDDIFDKLDEQRSQKLVDLMSLGIAEQVFITDASESRVERLIKDTDLPSYVFAIDEGSVCRVSLESGNLHADEEE
jgi:DNA replication and repair protein RecF